MRCDDISSKTLNLLNIFQVSSIKKKKKLLTCDNINRDFYSCEWSDAHFSKILKGRLEFNMVDGYMKLYGEGTDLVTCKYDGGDYSIKNKVLCPEFGKIKDEELEYESNDESVIEECGDDECGGEEEGFGEDIENVHCPILDQPLIKKGWAGPNYWKITHKKIKDKNNNIKKKKEKTFIDYKKGVDRRFILNAGNNNLLPSEIRERKGNYYFLPNDYQIGLEDIYKYITINKSIQFRKVEDVNNEPKLFTPLCDDMPESVTCNEELQINNEKMVVTDVVPDFGNVRATEAARNLFKNCAKVQKPVDIKKIKELMYENIESNAKSFTELYANIMDKNEISIQYYIVSLLHLANEKNVKIELNDENVCVKR